MASTPSKPPRSIACARCRKRKKKCDHGIPICGECRKSGAECVQYGSKKAGKFATVPVAYLQRLEARLSQLEGSGAGTGIGTGTGTDAVIPPTPLEPEAHQNLGYEESLSAEATYSSSFVSSCGDDGPQQAVEHGTIDSSSPDVVRSELGFLSQGDSVEVSGSRASAVSAMQGLNAQEDLALPDMASTGMSGGSPVAGHSTAWMSYALVDDGMIPTQTATMPSIGEDWMDQYANMYFQHIQPQWSFLDQSAWEESFRIWRRHDGHTQLDAHQQFMLRIVLAIGATLCGYSRLDRSHISHASTLHDSAIKNFFCHIMLHASALVRTQASLLLLVYYLHGPSSSPIYSALSLMTMHCGSLMAEHELSHLQGDRATEYNHVNRQIQRRTIMSCHIINEVISSAWTYPESHTLAFLDQKIFEYATRMRFEKEYYTAFEHLFQLRCIQSKIRHYNRKLKNLDPTDQFREWCRTRLEDELRLWKAGITAVIVSRPDGGPVYYNSESLSKLYDYSLSILLQEQPSTMNVEDLSHLLKACSEACRTFQASQEKDSVIYWTWSSLMYQFRVGIMLLYCYWITPVVLRTPVFSAPESLDGVRSCLTTMSRFATKWTEAGVFYQAYQCLYDATFTGPHLTNFHGDDLLSPSGTSPTHDFSGEQKRQMEGYIISLKGLHVHRAIVALVEEIVHKSPTRNFHPDRIEFPSLPLDDTDLFNFESNLFF